MEISFTAGESWAAPFYELYVEVGPHPESLPKLTAALEAVWHHRTLDGPYGDQSVEPKSQPKVDVADYISDEVAHMLGVATLPDRNRVPCGSVPHIPDLAGILGLPDEVHSKVTYSRDPLEPGPDAFTFYVPMGALDQLYGVDWENGALDSEVEEALDGWLVEVASTLFEQVRFVVGAIGYEGSYDLEGLGRGEDSGNVVLRPGSGDRLNVIRPPASSA